MILQSHQQGLISWYRVVIKVNNTPCALYLAEAAFAEDFDQLEVVELVLAELGSTLDGRFAAHGRKTVLLALLRLFGLGRLRGGKSAYQRTGGRRRHR